MLIKNPKVRQAIYVLLVVALLALLFAGRLTEEQIKGLPTTVVMVATAVSLIMAALNAPKSDPPT